MRRDMHGAGTAARPVLCFRHNRYGPHDCRTLPSPAMYTETAPLVEVSTPATQLPTLLIVGDPNGLNVAHEVLVELELNWEVVFAASDDEAHAVPAVRA